VLQLSSGRTFQEGLPEDEELQLLQDGTSYVTRLQGGEKGDNLLSLWKEGA
jgi:hypothetical protein